jgi:hypothetical protein
MIKLLVKVFIDAAARHMRKLMQLLTLSASLRLEAGS